MKVSEFNDLDAWICEHIMGWTKIEPQRKNGPRGLGLNPKISQYDYIPRYCTDQYYAMDVLKKCAEIQQIGLEICTRSGMAEVYTTVDPDGDLTKAEAQTLELAICLFAKQLFSQPTTKWKNTSSYH